MEDDLYGGIEKATVAEGALDATLYEGLFAGQSSSGHHEQYLQNKVNELEDLLRERNSEVQTLKAQLLDRNTKLLDVTSERDILLRNISCLYNTAKEEMARKQAEINSLRAEVANAKQQHHHHPQVQRPPQRALLSVAPGGPAGKRSREPDALELTQPQLQAGATHGGSSGQPCGAAEGGGGAKRPRCDGSRSEEGAGAREHPDRDYADVSGRYKGRAGDTTGQRGSAGGGPEGRASPSSRSGSREPGDGPSEGRAREPRGGRRGSGDGGEGRRERDWGRERGREEGGGRERGWEDRGRERGWEDRGRERGWEDRGRERGWEDRERERGWEDRERERGWEDDGWERGREGGGRERGWEDRERWDERREWYGSRDAERDWRHPYGRHERF
ncbi:hypothetical protein PLESTB_000436200 [Pleodorina starrii]|uniref:Uncharacterized protein n=1 Tax=Pleodorina starrii TaxID=330485 RepID=A0A9W6BFH0_9CHLO|nr:hypothetical protein PLESTB_000436200 [Pleodorina starrii]